MLTPEATQPTLLASQAVGTVAAVILGVCVGLPFLGWLLFKIGRTVVYLVGEMARKPLVPLGIFGGAFVAVGLVAAVITSDLRISLIAGGVADGVVFLVMLVFAFEEM